MEPTPWSDLPSRPGIYRLIDRRGRVIYVGRSSNLRSRVRSYWNGVDPYRPHLRGMIEKVARVDHVECVSEHAAAFLERDELVRLQPRYNRTYGVEAEWWLALSTDSQAPALEPVRAPVAAEHWRCFGPYLGGDRVRLAAAALLRLHPLHLTAAAPATAVREMARARGVTAGDREVLAGRITRVLEGEAKALSECVRALEELRDQAAASELFEKASELQETIRAVRWLAEPRSA